MFGQSYEYHKDVELNDSNGVIMSSDVNLVSQFAESWPKYLESSNN